MKKLISKLSAVALLAALVVVPQSQAASINGATAVVTNDGAIGETITVTSATNFPDGDEIASATVKNLDGTAAGATTLTAGGDNADDDTSVLTIAGANLTDNTAYILSFRTVSGDFGSMQIAVGTPTNNQVAVTATVEPTLTFNLDSSNIALGVLNTSYTDGNVTYDVATNANSGVSVAMDSAGLTDGTNGIGVSNLAGTEVANTFYKVSTHATPVFIDGGADLTTADGEDIGLTQTLYSVATPVSLSNQLVTVGAKITGVTPAGNYADTLTFSATATF